MRKGCPQEEAVAEHSADEAAASPLGPSMWTPEELKQGECRYIRLDSRYSTFFQFCCAQCLEGTLLKHMVKDELKYSAAACLEDLFTTPYMQLCTPVAVCMVFSTWHAAVRDTLLDKYKYYLYQPLFPEQTKIITELENINCR